MIGWPVTNRKPQEGWDLKTADGVAVRLSVKYGSLTQLVKIAKLKKNLTDDPCDCEV